CWLHDGVGVMQYEPQTAGVHRLRSRFRSFSDQVTITIKHKANNLFQGTVPVTWFDRDCEISADAPLDAGINTIALYLNPPQAAQRTDFLIVSCEVTPVI